MQTEQLESHSGATKYRVAIEIGKLPIAVRTSDSKFREMLLGRYSAFSSAARPRFEFDVDLIEPYETTDEDVEVSLVGEEWRLQRGDFRAEWNPAAGKGRIQQSANPYSIDCVLRIVHSLTLAREGGFLLHSASAIRNGRAFLFSGVSGAGKTTISRLAPRDTILLTDEISYVRRAGERFEACGTPFAGEMGTPGENCAAPLAALFFLAKGRENRVDAIPQGEAVRLLMRNILFFAHDAELVKLVFRSACEFAERVPVKRLTFWPDERVWELVQ
jgi:hypothetical protein